MRHVKNIPFLRYLIFCSYFFLAGEIYGQTPENAAWGKNGNDPSGRDVREKLYVHTDKNFYIAGEIVWFKLYCVDAALNQPLGISTVAYVEIVDRNNAAVLQAKIALGKEGGQGSFYLPISVSSDNYILRAYTSRMKNYGPSVYFEKEISIVNTIKTPGSPAGHENPEITARFFPEGGRLVSGLESKIGFTVTGPTGKGINAEGIVVDNNGDTVQHFSSRRYGIGSFVFRPAEGYTYNAVLMLPSGEKIVQPIPAAEQYGYVMNVSDDKNGSYRIKVLGKNKPGESITGNVFLVAHTKKAAKQVQQGTVNDSQEMIFYLDRDRLGDGVTCLTLFDREGRAVCERLVFIPPHQHTAATVIADRKEYRTRSEVNLSVSFPVDSGMEDAVNCSVSVFQTDSLQNTTSPDIHDYLWLTSYLSGRVESPGYYFSNDSGVGEAIENLMLTQGWRLLRRDSLSPVLKFKPETDGHLVTGRVFNTKTGRLVANARAYLSVPSQPFGFYLNQSDSTGEIRFNVKNYYGPGDIILQPEESNYQNYRVDLLSPFSLDTVYTPPGLLSVPRGMEEWLRGASVGVQAQNIYRKDSLFKYIPPRLSDTLPFFGKAEYSYKLDDYKRFTTMEEVLREYVLPVNVVLRNGRLYMGIVDDAMNVFNRNNMLVLVDGVPLHDPNKIFSFDPLKVKKLEVVPGNYVIGSAIFPGVASFETYEGRFSAFELDSSLVAIDYEGLQLQREFYSPVYSDSIKQERIPDFRTTLYWEPRFGALDPGSAHIRFFTSDRRGKFLVHLQGVGKKGEIISSTTSFVVD